MLSLSLSLHSIAAQDTLTLGVFSHRPKTIIAEKLQPLVDFINGRETPLRLELRILTLDEIDSDLTTQNLDFVLTNPTHYLLIRDRFELTGALATMLKKSNDTETSKLGGVVITAADSQLSYFAQLRNKRIAYPGKRFLGGFRTQAYELRLLDIDIEKSATMIAVGNHDEVVKAVVSGEVDAGFIRTGILEQLLQEGKLRPEQYKVVNPRHHADFPFVSSTRLYPEWPLVAMPHVSNQNIRQLLAALFSLPPHAPAAMKTGIAGFVPPADYLTVEQLSRTLRLPPFDTPPTLTWLEIWRQRQAEITTVLFALLIVLGMSVALFRANQNLSLSRDQLARSKSVRDAMLGTLPDMIWLKDNQTRFLACNKAYEAFHNRNESDLVGHTQNNPHDSSQIAHVLELEKNCLASGEVQHDECWLSQSEVSDSQLIQLIFAPIFDDQGAIAGVLGIGRDITEAYQTENELKERESYQRALLDNFPFMVWLKDTESRFQAVNQPFVEAAAVSASTDLIGKTDLDIWPETMARRYREDDREVMLGLCKKEVEEQITIDGCTGWFETYKAPVLDPDGKVLGTVGFARDITKRHELESQIRSERDLFSAGPVLVFIREASVGWPISYLSGNCEQVLGYSSAEVTDGHQSFIELLHPDDIARVSKEFRRKLAQNTSHFEQSYRLRKKDGDYAWFYDLVRPVYDDEGQVVKIHGYLYDQTTQKSLELELTSERQRLKSVIDGTRVGTWVWNIVTGETRFNERWADIVGHNLDELTPTNINTWMGFCHPVDLENSSALLRRHFSGELDYYECEVRMRHKQGHWVWVLDRGQVFEWDNDRKPLWMAGTHQDITHQKQAELALIEERNFADSIIQTAQAIVLVLDTEGNIVTFNPYMEALSGYSLDEVRGKEWFSTFLPANDQPQIRKVFSQSVTDIQVHGNINPILIKSGQERQIEWFDKTLRDAEGEVIGLLAIGQDVSERLVNEHNLRLMASVFSHAREGIIIADAEARIIDVNAQFCEITGYQRDEVVGQNPSLLSSGRQGSGFYAEMWRDLGQNGHWYGEIWNRRKNGEVYAEMLAISTVYDQQGDIQNYVALFSDITTQKQHQKQLEHIAHYDALTNLPNRVLLSDRLQQAMVHAIRRQNHVAVCYLDLDGFKAINDQYGHDVGDQLLTALSSRMFALLRESDTFARLGGDEFIAVLVDLPDGSAALPFLSRLLNAASHPIEVEGKPLQVTASLGVALYPQADEVDADQLLRQADQAMYQAKLGGKNQYHFFDAEQDRSLRSQQKSLEAIRQALKNNEFVLYYQPKVNMRTGHIVGVEALIRWLKPDTLALPSMFLPVVENNHLAVDLGEWVLQTALAQLAEWADNETPMELSINISAYHLQQPNFVARLKELLEKYPSAQPSQLVLEVLESTALEDLQRVTDVMKECQEIGVRFALDDFGTGYSTLTYLKNLPAAQLKIDQTFVRDMLDDPDDLAILEGVLGLATAFNRLPVAEGVESVEHGELLLMLGCEIGQGFGIAPPMNLEALALWVQEWQPNPSWAKQRPISRDALPLLFGLVEHRAWVKNVEAVVNGQSDSKPISEEGSCAFGQWFSSWKVEHHQHSGLIDEIELLHHQAHNHARGILDLYRQGASTTARNRLSELYKLRDGLLWHMRELIQQYRSDI